MRTAAAVGRELGGAATVLGRLQRSAARGVARRDGCFDGSARVKVAQNGGVHLWVHFRWYFIRGARVGVDAPERKRLYI